MAIKNHNIAKDAKIDRSKLNEAFGGRIFFEDFDDTEANNVDSTYGFDVVTTGAGTKTCQHNPTTSSAKITAGSGGGVATVLTKNSAVWDNSKVVTFRARMKVGPSLANVELQIGFADAAGMSGHADPIGDHDLAYWEYDDTTSTTWRLRTRVAGSAFVDLDTGIVVEYNTWYNLEIKMLNGSVWGSIGDTEFRAVSSSATKTAADWSTFARVEAHASETEIVFLDTWHVSSDRS